jgi:hypothetical protein
VKVKPGEIRPPSEGYRKEGDFRLAGWRSSGRSPPALHGLPPVVAGDLPAPILFYHIVLLVRQVAAYTTAIGSVRWTATVPAAMDGTEVMTGAAAVALPVSIGFTRAIIVVVGMQRKAPANWTFQSRRSFCAIGSIIITPFCELRRVF